MSIRNSIRFARPMARLLRALAALTVLAAAIHAQTYTIQTFAGGGLPINVLASATALPPVTAVATDQVGNLYIALADATVIRLSSNGLLTLFAGTGIPGFSGDAGPAISAQISTVRGLTVDNAGNVYLTDGSRVRKISGGIINTIAGTGIPGYGGDLGAATSAQLNNPLGVAVDGSGRVYIADTGNHRIRKIQGSIITTAAGDGVPGFSGDGANPINAQLTSPADVIVDSTGALFISDTGNNRVRRVASATINTVAGGGGGGLGDGGPALAAVVTGPQGITTDANGNLYIAESTNRVREVSGGVINTIAGTGVAGFSGDGGAGAFGMLNTPVSVAVNGGKLYIADMMNNRVRQVFGGLLGTAAGGGSPGDGGPALQAFFASPSELAIGPGGSLYISDTSVQRIRQVMNGNITTVAGNGAAGYSGDGGPATSASLNFPNGVKLDPSGNIFIADTGNCVVREVTSGGIATVAGTAPCGSGGANALASAPQSVAVDPAGNVYVADPANNVVRKSSPTGVVSTFAGTGVVGSAGDGGPANGALLNHPQHVATDAFGNVYISDTGNNRIRKVTTDGVIATIVGNGLPGFAGDGALALNAQIRQPGQVAVDTMGNLFFADTGNFRVREVSGGVITSIAGNSVEDFTGDNGPALAASLDNPVGVAVDLNGNVYVSETATGRVRVLIPAANGCSFALSASSFAPGVGGGSFPLNVATAAGCAWSILNLPSWISASGGGSGTGSGTVTLQVAANSGLGRTAIIFVAGLAVTITEASPIACVYALSNGAQGFSSLGGVGVVTVTALPGCTWSAISNAPFITVTAGGGASGTGTFAYQVAVNASVARTGTISVAGLLFNVDEAAASASLLTGGGAAAQMTSGAGWKTTFSFVNNGNAAAQMRLNLFGDNGSPALLPLNFPQNTASLGVELAATLDRTILPGALLVIEVVVPPDQPNVEGWAQLLTNGDISGVAAVRYNAGATDHQGSVLFETRVPPAFVLPYDNTNGFVTGVAIANVGPAGSSVGLVFRDDTGSTSLTTALTMPVGTHLSFVLPDNYSFTAGKRGTLEVDAPGGSSIAIVGIEFNTTTFGFSTIPPLTKP